MGEPFVGEIRMFGGSFAPAGWAFCSGQLMAIAENETLFQLIGTTYGGDGQSTFGLPDLQGRLPLHQGNGFVLAQNGGVETVTLTTQQIPAHTHPMLASTSPGTQNAPSNSVTAASANPISRGPTCRGTRRCIPGRGRDCRSTTWARPAGARR